MTQHIHTRINPKKTLVIIYKSIKKIFSDNTIQMQKYSTLGAFFVLLQFISKKKIISDFLEHKNFLFCEASRVALKSQEIALSGNYLRRWHS